MCFVDSQILKYTSMLRVLSLGLIMIGIISIFLSGCSFHIGSPISINPRSFTSPKVIKETDEALSVYNNSASVFKTFDIIAGNFVLRDYDSNPLSLAEINSIEEDLVKILNELLKKAKSLYQDGYLKNLEYNGNFKDVSIEIIQSPEAKLSASLGDNTIKVYAGYIEHLLAYMTIINEEDSDLIDHEEPIFEGGGKLVNRLASASNNMFDSMFKDLMYLSVAISYMDALRFSLAHELSHIFLDSRISNPSLENEIRADGLGYLLMTETSVSYLIQKKANERLMRTLSYSTQNMYEMAAFTAENGAEVLFTAFKNLGVERDSRDHLSVDSSLSYVENLRVNLIDINIDGGDEDLQTFYWALTNKLINNEDE